MRYIIEGEQVGLTEPKEEHIELYRDWFNDLEVTHFIGYFGAVHTTEDEQERYQTLSENDAPGFTIHYLPDDKPIGRCGFHSVDHKNDNAELGIILGEKEYWNKGLGSETVRLLTDFGFDVLNLHGINLVLKSFNERARRVYEKVGYQVSGRVRDFCWVNGSYHDKIIMDILREEFYETNEHLIKNKYLSGLE